MDAKHNARLESYDAGLQSERYAGKEMLERCVRPSSGAGRSRGKVCMRGTMPMKGSAKADRINEEKLFVIHRYALSIARKSKTIKKHLDISFKLRKLA